MFFFGSLEDIARSYLDEAIADSGVYSPDIHMDEMSLTELTYRAIQVRMAMTQAAEHGAPEEVFDALHDWYVEIYREVITHDLKIRAGLPKGAHNFISTQEKHLEPFRVMYKDLTGYSLPF